MPVFSGEGALGSTLLIPIPDWLCIILYALYHTGCIIPSFHSRVASTQTWPGPKKYTILLAYGACFCLFASAHHEPTASFNTLTFTGGCRAIQSEAGSCRETESQ